MKTYLERRLLPQPTFAPPRHLHVLQAGPWHLAIVRLPFPEGKGRLIRRGRLLQTKLQTAGKKKKHCGLTSAESATVNTNPRNFSRAKWIRKPLGDAPVRHLLLQSMGHPPKQAGPPPQNGKEGETTRKPISALRKQTHLGRHCDFQKTAGAMMDKNGLKKTIGAFTPESVFVFEESGQGGGKVRKE